MIFQITVNWIKTIPKRTDNMKHEYKKRHVCNYLKTERLHKYIELMTLFRCWEHVISWPFIIRRNVATLECDAGIFWLFFLADSYEFTWYSTSYELHIVLYILFVLFYFISLVCFAHGTVLVCSTVNAAIGVQHIHCLK